MILVHELSGILGSQYFGFIMTLETLPFRDMTIPSYHIGMTFFAGHPSRNIFSMVKTPTLNLNVPFGFDVARGASSHRTRDTFLFPFRSGLKKVTDEAVGFMNRKVQSLNQLSMAGGASKVHAPSQFT
jgi:hypothetical protein